MLHDQSTEKVTTADAKGASETVVERQLDERLSAIENVVAGLSAPEGSTLADDGDRPLSPKILMVDDEPFILSVVAEFLKLGGYRELVRTSNPSEALAMAVREQPDAILLDLHMPGSDGFDILKSIRAEPSLAWTPVVILTGSTDYREKLYALELGATDFVQKPIHRGELVVRLRNILLAKAYQDHWRDYSSTLERAVRQRTAELESSRQELIHCLARAGEFRDDDTGNHVVRVGKYARLIGKKLGMKERELDILEQAAKLHDIGKIGVPDAILFKAGRLTAKEISDMQKHIHYGREILQGMQDHDGPQIRQHSQIGAKILDGVRSPILALAMKVALTHHERWDGTGYPQGLSGEAIPLEGRITAVADVFDALSTKRPYKPAFPLEDCFRIMEEGRGTHFDPRVLDAFLACRDEIVQFHMGHSTQAEPI